MPFNEICKLEVVNFLYIFDQCQESYLLTDIALLSCEDYIYLLTPQSYSSWVIDGESQCSLMIMAIYTGHRIISKNKKTEKESNSIENEE